MILNRSTPLVWLLVLIVVARTSFADERSVQVTLNDKRNQPVAGADVQLERLDGKGKPQVSKADPSGRVVFKNVPAGSYKVSAFTKNSAAATAVDVSKDSRSITLSMAPITRQAGGKKKHYVYIAGETGTHIGGGRWVAVEDDASGTGTSAVDKRDGRMLTDPSSAPHLFQPPGP
jgi:hypothetical protein